MTLGSRRMMSAVNLRNSSRLGCYLPGMGLCLDYRLSLFSEASLSALSRDLSQCPFTQPHCARLQNGCKRWQFTEEGTSSWVSSCRQDKHLMPRHMGRKVLYPDSPFGDGHAYIIYSLFISFFIPLFTQQECTEYLLWPLRGTKQTALTKQITLL